MFITSKYVSTRFQQQWYLELTRIQISWIFVINSVTIVVVQAFFGWRAWRVRVPCRASWSINQTECMFLFQLMHKSKIIAATIVSFVLGAAIAGVALKFVCLNLGVVLNPTRLKVPA